MSLSPWLIKKAPGHEVGPHRFAFIAPDWLPGAYLMALCFKGRFVPIYPA